MIEGARQLMRLHGYGATSFKDVWQYAGTPRGSVYFHFPNGKEELGLEVVAATARKFVTVTQEAGAASRSRQEFIRTLARSLADEAEHENYTAGCPVASVALEMANTSPALLAAAERASNMWRQAISDELEHKGASPSKASEAAALLVSAIQGARLMAKTFADRDPIDRIGALLAHVADES